VRARQTHHPLLLTYLKLLLKSIASLLVAFLPSLSHHPHLSDFFSHLLAILKTSIPILPPLVHEIVAELADEHPLTFLPFLPAFVEHYLSNLNASEATVTIPAILFLSNTLRTRAYKDSLEEQERYAKRHLTSPYTERVTKEKVDLAHKTLPALFPPQRLAEMMKHVITRLLPLSQSELELWERDPTMFLYEEFAEPHRQVVSAAAQYLYYELLRYDDSMAKLVIELIKEGVAQSGMTLETILLKDACYAALAMVYFFIPFFSSVLMLFLCRDLIICAQK